MRSALPAKVNGCLDKPAHPRVRVFGRSIAAFRLCGYVGLAVAVSLAMALVTYSGLSRWVMSGVVAAAVCTFFALVLLTKVLSGVESLTYYHHEAAVLSVAAAGLWLVDQPVLPYLDPTILGVGAFMACGRVGCLMAGCCYGRVQDWGVRYGREHVAEGFPSCYLGVGLFPVQALESLWVSFVVVAGSAMILNGGPPGLGYVFGTSHTTVAGDHPFRNAARYTAGLSAEPGCRSRVVTLTLPSNTFPVSPGVVVGLLLL
jgi:hypothetical protein